MKVALVHDWLTGMRGGEKCLEVFCEIFPKAHLYTLLHVPGSVSSTIENMDIRTSLLQHLPGARTAYRYYLPLFPAIVESWKTSKEEYDLVLSSCHCVAKGVPFPYARRRVCYCFTPMRYLWCQTENYYRNDWRQFALSLVRAPLKRWDLHSNLQVDEFIGISDHVSHRIRTYYRREATTLYPPVDVEFFTPVTNSSPPREDFYLVVGALEPYKRVDLAIEACVQTQRRLVVIGKGTMAEELRRKAPSNIEFLGWRSDEEIRAYYRRARALIFPGEEDFGIVPLEAQACGCPVIAYGAGGCLETVIENQTGLFFHPQSVEALQAAILEFEQKTWDLRKLRENAERFGRTRFRREMELYLGKC